MPTLWQTDVREHMAERIERLTLASTPGWGRMNVGQMLAHLGDVQRIALGEKPTARVGGIYRFRPVAQGFDQDRESVLELIRKFAEKEPGGLWPEHPLFGSINGKDWGAFCAKHLDHHLRQFGV